MPFSPTPTKPPVARSLAATLATAASVLAIALEAAPVRARPVTYDFTVTVTEGSLAGKEFSGTLRYDDAALSGEGEEVLDTADGLAVEMDFLGEVYENADDAGYPNFPQLFFENGEIRRLDFWIEPGDRLPWWTLPGWDATLTPRDR